MDHSDEISVKGITRKYRIHIPDSEDVTTKLPVVVFFHGMGGTADHASKKYGWVEKADQEKFIVVFPEASQLNPLKPMNFVSNPTSWDYHPSSRIDDIGFIRELLVDLEKCYPIDIKRIFFTGFSSGASMAFHATVLFSSQIAALAVISGHLTLFEKPEFPPSLMLILGTKDKVNPLMGGAGHESPWSSKPVPKAPMQETIDTWVSWIGAQKKPTHSEEKGDVKIFTYGPSPSGKKVVYILIEKHGHEWPGTPRVLPEELTGPTTESFNATDAIWEFFKNV